MMDKPVTMDIFVMHHFHDYTLSDFSQCVYKKMSRLLHVHLHIEHKGHGNNTGRCGCHEKGIIRLLFANKVHSICQNE